MKKKLYFLLFILTILSGCQTLPKNGEFPRPDYVEEAKP